MIWDPKAWAFVRVHITSMQMVVHTRNLSDLGITCLLSPALPRANAELYLPLVHCDDVTLWQERESSR